MDMGEELVAVEGGPALGRQLLSEVVLNRGLRFLLTHMCRFLSICFCCLAAEPLQIFKAHPVSSEVLPLLEATL
jgi:hypothetical protein